MTTYTTEKKSCPRCKGTGMTGHVVVYAGAPGTCFMCAGAGQIFKDKFYRKFGVGKRFFGVTLVTKYRDSTNPNNGTFKMLATEWKPENQSYSPDHTWSAVEITEEQARSFWLKYGERTICGGVRVKDC
jgi:hypothetical protein